MIPQILRLPMLLGAAVLIAFCQKSLASEKKIEVIIATGTKGGSYYPMGIALAQLISRRLPLIDVKVRETSGGAENLRLIASGEATLAFVNASTAWDAVSGQDSFKGEHIELRCIAALSPNTMHLVVRGDSVINSIAALKGRRLSVGVEGSGTKVIVNRMLKVYNLDKPSDISLSTLGLAESITALENGKIDAFFFGGTTPVSAIAAFIRDGKSKVKLVENASAVTKLNMVYGPLYRVGKIPAGTYLAQQEEIGALDVWDLLVTSDRLDGKLAYEVARLIFEGKEELLKSSRNLSALNINTQEKNAVISLHSGAQRYLAEQGVQPFARQFGLK